MAYKGNKEDLGKLLLTKRTDLTGDDVKSWKKSKIIELLEESDNPLDRVEVVADAAVTEKKEVAAVPQRGDSGWTNHVLSLLDKTEKIQGQPTVDGLRRIFDDLVGPIMETEVIVVQSPSPENERRAVVTYVLKFLDLHDNLQKTISDAADCYYGNTPDPYKNHAVATATSMAEGRCLRKAMRIKVITSEEAVVPDKTQIELAENALGANEVQKDAMRRLSSSLGFTVDKLIRHYLSDKMPQDGINLIDLLSYKESQTLMQHLNDMRRGVENGGKIIPPELISNVAETK